MNHGSRLTICVLVTVSAIGAMAPAARAARADFYVATNGKDTWSGTLDRPNAQGTDGPLATLEGARDAIRGLKGTSRRSEALTVMLRGGTYLLSKPFVLRPEDSGTEGCPVTYMAYPGETPVLSGGRRITGWKPANGKLWVTQIAEVKAGTWTFRQLFVAGQRRDRAQLPNEDEGSYRVVGPIAPKQSSRSAKNKTGFRYRTSDIDKNWAGLDDAELVFLQHWTEARMRIGEIDDTNHTITFTGQSWRPVTWSFGYYIENLMAGLDRPGEWCLARKTGLVHYRPMPGEDLRAAEVVAPVATQLVRLEGDVDARQFVRHVTLQGLTFSHTHWQLPKEGYACSQAELPPPAAVQGEGALHCCFEQNTFVHLGAWGLELGRGCQDNRVVGNRFEDLGAGGMKIGRKTRKFTSIKDVDEACRMLISRNTLRDGCRIHLGSPAIWIGQSGGNVLSHNEISGAWQWGISVGWDWFYWPPNRARDNRIEYNHVHHMGANVLGTHAGIYLLGNSPNTLVRYNRVHHINGTGIILDEGCAAVLVESNLVHHTRYGAFCFNFSCFANIIGNNVFALGEEAQWTRYGDPPSRRPEPLNANLIQQNIYYWKQGKLFRRDHWHNFTTLRDYNLYFDASGRPIKFLEWSLEEWRRKKYLDQHSIIADPLFVDPDNGDFRLKAGSPAIEKLGFRPLPLDKMPAYKKEWSVPWPSPDCPWVRRRRRAVGSMPHTVSKSVFTVPKRSGAVTIDGVISPGEWAGADPQKAMVIEQDHKGGLTPAPKSHGWLAYDQKYLYVAIRNRVAPGKPLRKGNIWGQDDAVEVALGLPRQGDATLEDSIIVLRGYPSGHHQSSTEAGASAKLAKQVGDAAAYAARIETPKTPAAPYAWTAEWRIPFAALGIKPRPGLELPFNLSVRRTAEDCWVTWAKMPGMHTWCIGPENVIRIAGSK